MDRVTETRKNRKRKKNHLIWLLPVIAILLIIVAGAGYFLSARVVKADGQTYVYRMGKKTYGLQHTMSGTYLLDTKTCEAQTGFQNIKAGLAYFNPETGKMETGSQEIGGYYYDFNKTTGADNPVKAYEAVANQLKGNNKYIEGAIANGMKLVGKSPYDYGGGRDAKSIAKNQFDCSSFAAYMYREAGLHLVVQEAASTTLLAETGTTESWNDKQRGDLLITPDTDSEDEMHVAIYLGGGFILHDSASTGGVNISRMNAVIDEKVLGNMTWNDLFEPGTVQREV